MYVLGIDPGWSGGAALVSGDHTAHEAVSFTTLTEPEIVAAVQSFAFRANIAYIEKVGAFPKQGVVSMFKFGHAYGLVRAAVIGSGLGIKEVSPIRWQTALNCRTGGNKNVSKNRAQLLFGGIKVTHGTADALLIAEYGVMNESSKM